MDKWLFYPVGSTPAIDYAADFLRSWNIPLVDHPTPEVTHLLLDIPSFDSNGHMRGGENLSKLLSMLPGSITVIGGNLPHTELKKYRTIDLLKDPVYLAMNAAITADCALQVAAPLLKTTFADSSVLVIGWGRIGKCLARLLKGLGAHVTVAARKESDRAILQALAYTATDLTEMVQQLPEFQLIFNTAPEMVLSKDQLQLCKNCVKIDLASKCGIEGEDVVWARGLPGIYAPKTSGKLIAQSVFHILKEEQ